MAAIAAIEARERQKREAERAEKARKTQLLENARIAEELRQRLRTDLHHNILHAINDGREDDAVSLMKNDEVDTDLLSIPDEVKNTILHRAAARGLWQLCKDILTKFDDSDMHIILDARTDKGCTPLHLAARMSHTEVCAHLLEVEADAGARDLRGWTARDCAQYWGMDETAAVLKEATMVAEAKIAAENRRRLAELEAARLAAIKPPDLNSRQALIEAFNDKRLEDCFTVLSNKNWLYTNEMDFRGRTALHLAAEKGSTYFCSALLARPDFKKAGVRDKDKSTALHYAVGNRCIAASLVIIESSNFNAIDEVNIREQTALTLATQRGEIMICKALLKRMSLEAIRIVDKFGLCALEYADENESFEIAAEIRAAMGQ